MASSAAFALMTGRETPTFLSSPFRPPLRRWRGDQRGALRERKERLRDQLSNAGMPLQYSDHQIGRGPEFYARACELSLEGIISEAHADDRGL